MATVQYVQVQYSMSSVWGRMAVRTTHSPQKEFKPKVRSGSPALMRPNDNGLTRHRLTPCRAFPPTSDKLDYRVFRASPTTLQADILYPTGRTNSKDFGGVQFQRRTCLSTGVCHNLFVLR